MSVPMITGYYPYTRAGITHPPRTILQEIEDCLEVNPFYREKLIVMAGDTSSAKTIERFGLSITRTFDDAPSYVHSDAAHKMKHWMCLWALKEYGEFLWVDWDTVMLKEPDEHFWQFCRSHDTPKFIFIPKYEYIVNCGVYYASDSWADAMESSFKAEVREPNDELLWASVLPSDVRSNSNYWWGKKAFNVWEKEELNQRTPETYFLHIRHLSWAENL